MVKNNASATDSGAVSPWVRAVAVSGTVLIAGNAFWLSFTALRQLAQMARVPEWQAWAWPLIVDGLIVVSTIAIMALNGRRGVWFPWLMLAVTASVSIAGNSLHAVIGKDATIPSPLAAAVAAVPPLALVAVTHMTSILTRPADADDADVVGAAVETTGVDAELASVTAPPGDVPRRADMTGTRPALGDPSPLRFLVDYLMRAGGTASAAEVIAAAAIQGFTDTQIKDARRRSTRPVIASTKDGVTGGWVWTVESAFEGGTV